MQAIIFWLIYPLLWLLSKLPFRTLYIVSDIVYIILYRVLGYRKKTVRHNLALAFPEKTPQERKHIEKEFYHHLCDLFLEMIKTISITKEQLTKRMVFTNASLLQEYKDQGKSVIMLLGHYASYEWSFALQLHLKYTGYGIYKKIKNKRFDTLVRQIRGRWNTELISNKFAAKRMHTHKKDNIVSTYGFAADQSPILHRARYWTDFFGYQLPFFTGVERIAKDLDLPIVYLKTIKTKRGHYQGTFVTLAEQPTEFKDFDITAAFAKALESQIKEDPRYYLWTHKRFKLLGKKEQSPAKD